MEVVETSLPLMGISTLEAKYVPYEAAWFLRHRKPTAYQEYESSLHTYPIYVLNKQSSWEFGIEPSSFIKCWETIERPNNCWPLE
jgi:hypothetical protein